MHDLVKFKCHFSWQVCYLVMFKCHFLCQAQYLVKFKCRCLWQVQYLVMSIGRAYVRLPAGFFTDWSCWSSFVVVLLLSKWLKLCYLSEFISNHPLENKCIPPRWLGSDEFPNFPLCAHYTPPWIHTVNGRHGDVQNSADCGIVWRSKCPWSFTWNTICGQRAALQAHPLSFT